ncbi:MAG: helix-turn-helix transcriptional regulator [Acidimicrobiaceae bacterium]|nr:helix-turn-helix transcriptional regulator [Acidimicrobiaceae bacterium]MXW76036.1 helix-turn-helix transcriptional regulator [Acidimicrobiaceae bacterium]MYA75067.1 helix-turn-helix transcriptional regulator [Acidimicrobiaceae bacterium]MYC43276.1 helix-turn-helix transcriptional regulator [Acidimicrobiaceae bacterium]MYD06177.1 helix-turn-helix transcriptional regulator [Acidimicrobiaceae bacterium]
MPSSKNFSTLGDRARQDPERARRIDETKQRVAGEIVSCRLAELRKALGVTQVELAEMIGKSQSAVSQIEHGEIGLSLDMLRSIVHQLGGEVEVAAVFDDRRVLIHT